MLSSCATSSFNARISDGGEISYEIYVRSSGSALEQSELSALKEKTRVLLNDGCSPREIRRGLEKTIHKDMGKMGFIAMRIVKNGPEGRVENITKSSMPYILMVGAILIVILLIFAVSERYF
ncbi:MAG: hypothetical protein E7019_04620 [Alphaproteobacteria bacterium]|nr:hypothetical protein [Alphaproteobacteria bacterium]